MALNSTLLGGLLLSMCIAAIGYRYNNLRRLQLYEYQLIPNCLLARFPLIFISGKQSLFYHGRYWNFIPQYLEDHGYEVLNMKLPWRNSKSRMAELKRLAEVLIQEKTPSHWLCDISSASEIQSLLRTHPKAFQSVRILGDENFKNGPWHGLNLFIHNLIWGNSAPICPQIVGITQSKEEIKEIGKSYLRIAIELAEQDHQEETPHDTAFDATAPI